MAANALIGEGGELARLSEESLRELDTVLPSYWKRKNPVDLLRDANLDRFVCALAVGLNDPGVDGLLIIYTPQGVASSDDVARALVKVTERAWKPVIAAFMGAKRCGAAKRF